MKADLRVYFLHRHIRDTVVILEDDNLPSHYSPVVILWYRELPLMDNIPPPPSAPRGKIRNRVR